MLNFFFVVVHVDQWFLPEWVQTKQKIGRTMCGPVFIIRLGIRCVSHVASKQNETAPKLLFSTI